MIFLIKNNRLKMSNIKVEEFSGKNLFQITEKKDNLSVTISHIKNESKEFKKFLSKIETIKEKKQDCYYLFKYPSFIHKIRTTKRQLITCMGLDCYVFNKKTENVGKHVLEYVHPAVGPNFICSKIALICLNKFTKIKLTDMFFSNLCQIFINLKFPPLLWKEIYYMKNISEDVKENMIFIHPDKTIITIDVSILFATYFIQHSKSMGIV
jgi:hypothetical protein